MEGGMMAPLINKPTDKLGNITLFPTIEISKTLAQREHSKEQSKVQDNPNKSQKQE